MIIKLWLHAYHERSSINSILQTARPHAILLASRTGNYYAICSDLRLITCKLAHTCRDQGETRMTDGHFDPGIEWLHVTSRILSFY